MHRYANANVTGKNRTGSCDGSYPDHLSLGHRDAIRLTSETEIVGPIRSPGTVARERSAYQRTDVGCSSVSSVTGLRCYITHTHTHTQRSIGHPGGMILQIH